MDGGSEACSAAEPRSGEAAEQAEETPSTGTREHTRQNTRAGRRPVGFYATRPNHDFDVFHEPPRGLTGVNGG